MSEGYLTAEARARVEIDLQLETCGWVVQDRKDLNLYAGQGVAVREFIMAAGHGRADYLLFVDGKAVGAVEAKPSGTPLAGVESQSAKYAAGLPKDLPALVSPLPFLYESTDDETMFTDGFDPELGQLDAGLFFLSFQNDPQAFIDVQNRLGANDALNEYIKHVGSAVFAVPGGTSPGQPLAAGLFV